VQKTEPHARLLHLSTTGNAFCIIISLLIVAAVSACAEEPVSKLTLENHHQPPVETNVPAQMNLLSSPESSLFDLKSSPPATSRPGKEAAVEFSTDARLEQSAKSGQGDSFQLAHENRTSSSRSNMSFSIHVGYGKIWDEKSVLSKISADHQETGCAYVRANFSF